jgi:xanthine dehydrogenase accessory factor
MEAPSPRATARDPAPVTTACKRSIMASNLIDLLRAASDLRDSGEQARVCIVVKARGSTPQSAGSMMVVSGSSEIMGTVGGGCVEAEVRRLAMQMIADGRSGLLRFTLDHDYGWDDGLICGGTIEIAVVAPPARQELAELVHNARNRQPASWDFSVADGDAGRSFRLDVPVRERLYIAGAGHVGQALARSALALDFEITLFDDRHDLLSQHSPSGVTQVCGEIAQKLRAAPVDPQTYAVVVTRGHRHDEQALGALVGRGARYVGMIGSRRKVKLIFDELMERGVTAQELATVHAPIGLPIGAVSVEEIAVSIAAQLVEVRRSAPVKLILETTPSGIPVIA